MKRRLALLLALSLSFASFPVTGVGAAEADTPAAATQTVEQAEETQPEETEEATENEDAGTDKSGEAAVEAASTETAAEVTESAEKEENAEVAEEASVADTTETEAAPEEEASAAATTSEEAAVVEEPAAVEESAVAEEPAAAEESAVAAEEPAAAPVPAKVDPKTVKTQTETKKVADGWYSNNTVYYKNGKKVTGLQYLVFNGVTRTFFFNSSGVKQTGWKTIDNKGTVCYFADDRWPSLPKGAMLTGLRKLGNYWFYMADSSFATSHNVKRGKQMTGWQTIGGSKYYFATSGMDRPVGAALTGWKNLGGKLYYFADWRYPKQHEGQMLLGWKIINGKTFFLADSRSPQYTTGTVVKGLAKIGTRYFLFNNNGIMVRGWTTYNGRPAYYDSKLGMGKKGWHAKGSAWYYTYETGVAKVGWLKTGNDLYYLDPAQNGKMATGSVLMPSGRLFFFDSEGRRATTTGWKSVGGYNYYTYANGTCARNTTIDGVKLDSMGRSTMTAIDRKAQGYTSNTNYLILVNKGEYKVCVYKGSQYSWSKVKEWYCTHGGSNTPNGTWTLDDHVTKRSAKYGWAVFDYSSAAFASHISAGNYFHSILYEKYIGLYYPNTNPYDEEPMDPDLKQSYSHGCIRLETENAEWIWDNVPLGTKVVVY